MAASIRGTAVTTAIAVVASLGLLLPGTATVAAGAEQGRLSVAPDRGPAGSHAQVDGAGFADGRAVEIRWEPTGERLGTATGPEFATTVSIPGDATEGSHAIGARGQPREAGAGDARHATTPFTVTAANDPDDVVAGEDDDLDSAAEDEAGTDQPADADDESGESGDGDADDGGEDSSEGSDGSQADDDDSEPSEEPQSAEDADSGSDGTDGGSGDGDGESSSDTSGDGAPQRTSMSPNPDDDAAAESDGQETGGQEADSDERDPQADPAPDSDENEPSDPAEASSGKAETATAASRETDDDGGSATDEDGSSATTYRKSSSGPPAAVSHEVGEVQPSAVEEPPEVDFAAALDSEAFQAQDAPAPEVAADVPAPPDAAARERLATAGDSRSRQVPAATEPSTPQGTPAAVGTQAAAPNSEEISLLVLLATSGALVVWHRRRQPLLKRR